MDSLRRTFGLLDEGGSVGDSVSAALDSAVWRALHIDHLECLARRRRQNDQGLGLHRWPVWTLREGVWLLDRGLVGILLLDICVTCLLCVLPLFCAQSSLVVPVSSVSWGRCCHRARPRCRRIRFDPPGRQRVCDASALRIPAATSPLGRRCVSLL